MHHLNTQKHPRADGSYEGKQRYRLSKHHLRRENHRHGWLDFFLTPNQPIRTLTLANEPRNRQDPKKKQSRHIALKGAAVFSTFIATENDTLLRRNVDLKMKRHPDGKENQMPRLTTDRIFISEQPERPKSLPQCRCPCKVGNSVVAGVRDYLERKRKKRRKRAKSTGPKKPPQFGGGSSLSHRI